MVNCSCGYTNGKSSPCDVLKRPALPLFMPGESSTIQYITINQLLNYDLKQRKPALLFSFKE